MKESATDVSTDSAWEEWGRRDPYFGVITQPRFRLSAMDQLAKQEFFDSGASHANHVLATIRRHIDPNFTPKKILDFGCGVGRLLIPFAAVAEEVVGLDVSQSMLREARRNCDERQLRNVRLICSDDRLSGVTDTYNLVHSCIVFQHIPVNRGRTILKRLLQHVSSGGVAAIHLTYSKTRFEPTHGVAPAEMTPVAQRERHLQSDVDPEIQMNPYNMNEILFLLQQHGTQQCHLEFSDHGGELGVFMFFAPN
jgi:SAM-dependent methyltransferase